MYFHFEIRENGTKNMFRYKLTRKNAPLTFSDIKVLTEM